MPFYVYHKVLAGMIDQAVLAGNAQALEIAIGMAKWAKVSASSVPPLYSRERGTTPCTKTLVAGTFISPELA